MENDLSQRTRGQLDRWITLCFVMILSASLVAITLALLGQTRPVRAATYCVKPGGGDGCMGSIQAAVAQAGSGDIIRVAPGTYIENVVISKTVTLQGGWSPDFSHRDLKAYIATIFPADNTQSVVSILGQFADTNAVAPTLDGFVITGGRADLGSNHGGGLRIIDSNATVISNTIKNNVAFLLGGGVWVQRGAPTLLGNQITENQTVGLGQDAHGGGVQLENSQAALMDNLIMHNVVTGTQTYGGGLEISGSGIGQVTLRGNQFISNTATSLSNAFGGALALMNGQVSMQDNVVFSNTAVMGGGIFIGGNFEDCCNLTGQRNLIQANQAVQGGGGFLISIAGAISLTNSAAIANMAGGDGGAILNSGIVTFTNVTVSANSAGGMGGGIANFNLVNLANVTVSDNDSTAGAGLFNANTVTTINSVIALNQGDNCLGVLSSLGHNLEDGGTCALGQPTDMSNIAASLIPLGENGALTPSHALASDSPAIDAGDSTACAPFDQRGVPRPIDGNRDGLAVCDIGAYEYQLPLYAPVIKKN